MDNDTTMLALVLSAILMVCVVPLVLVGYWSHQRDMEKIEVCKASQNITECLKEIK